MLMTSRVSWSISACRTLRGMPSSTSVSWSGRKRPVLVLFSMNWFQRLMVGWSGTRSPRLEYSRKTSPSELSVLRLRKTSPQAQWKKWGIVPRILPWVPFPAPGAPNRRAVRYFMIGRGSRVSARLWLRPRCAAHSGELGVFVLESHFLDFDERDHHFLGSVALLDL